MSYNYSDLTTISVYFNCEINLTTISSPYFNQCLKYFLIKSLPLTIISFSIVIISTLTNLILIYLLIKKNCTQIVFDRILLSHAFVDLLTNLFDLPVYHIIIIFNTFPFNRITCFYYLTMDNCTSTIEILHFFYMSYARIRCVLAPKLYQNEFLILQSNRILASIWAMCVIFWTALVYIYSIKDFEEGMCNLNFKYPYAGIIYILIGYYFPLLFTIGATIFVILVIKTKLFLNNQYSIRSSKSRRLTNKQNSLLNSISTHLFKSPQMKLAIISFVFVVCYFPSATILLINAFKGRTAVRFNYTDILAFSASMWNPILILTLSYKFFIKKR